MVKGLLATSGFYFHASSLIYLFILFIYLFIIVIFFFARRFSRGFPSKVIELLGQGTEKTTDNVRHSGTTATKC